MKVSELIEKLKDLPPDADVLSTIFIDFDKENIYGEVKDVFKLPDDKKIFLIAVRMYI